MTAEGAPELHDTAERRLRRIDQRYTAGRRAIIELLVSAGHPVSISDIAEGLPDLPRSSAYRHLVDLQAVGRDPADQASGLQVHEVPVGGAARQVGKALGDVADAHRVLSLIHI